MTTTKRILTVGSAVLTALAVNPMGVFAQLPPPQQGDQADISNVSSRFQVLQAYTPGMFIKTLINFLLGIAGVASFIILLWGGIQWILAGGDKEGTEKARKKITNALIGLAIVFSAYALLFILRALFNIDVISVNLVQIGADQ